MPFLNLNVGFLIYEDQTDVNPKIKLPDLSFSAHGVNVDHEKSERITIYPNEIKDIATTSRNVLWDNTTQLSFERYLAAGDNIRIKWTGTGTNPVFRTNRNIGGSATTEISITRVTPYVARLTQTSGTALTLSSVQVNDFLKFEKNTDSFTSPLHPTNVGKTFLVQSKGANYIDFIDNGEVALDTAIPLGADFSFVLRVMSQGPVKIGDTIGVSGSSINPSNIGQFTIVDVSPEYIEITNPLSSSETVLYGTNQITVYEYLIGFVNLRANGRFKIRFDDQTEWVRLDRVGKDVLFMGAISAHKIQAMNDGVDTVTVSIQHAAVL